MWNLDQFFEDNNTEFMCDNRRFSSQKWKKYKNQLQTFSFNRVKKWNKNIKMGSLQHCCRLCAMAVPEDQQVRLAYHPSSSNRSGENVDESLTSKLRFFLNLNVTPEDFSLIACTHCINSLEFCIQVIHSNSMHLLVHRNNTW